MYRFDYCDGFAVISVTVSLELNWNTLGLNDTVTLITTIWEWLFISVHDPSLVKDIVVGNIYRPPKDNNNRGNVDTFARELEPILARISDTRAEIFLAGDYNINF